MAQQYKGPVTWISFEEKYGNYAARLKDVDGFFKTGQPWPDGVKKGAVIEVTARTHPKGGFEIKPGSIKVLEAPKSKGGWSGGKKGGGKGGWNDPEREAKIQWQHSQEMAIQAAECLLTNEAYKLGAKNKPQERFKQILGLIDDLTVRFFNDIAKREPLSNSKAISDEVDAAADEPEEEPWDDEADPADEWADDDWE